MTDVSHPLARGRDLYERRHWGDAFEALSTLDEETGLGGEDLERLATAAYLIGRDGESADHWARAHQEYLEAGQVARAVRCAFWLAIGLFHKGERARGGGWLARARRLLESDPSDCVERGYLLLPEGLRHIGEGEVAKAYDAFREASETGARFDDPDLIALGLHSRGRALIRLGRIDEGVGLLDEAMAAVEAGDVAPLAAGDVYCSVIEGCAEIFDLGRAREWTAALTRWCEGQPDLVPYRGQCLVRRAEIMRLHGAWPDALHEARRACEWLSRPPGEPAAGEAFYQQAELLRLRGEFDEAEEAYRQANRWGRKPLPGLAQLRLAQERTEVAASTIRQAVNETRSRHVRAHLLPAHVEIMLAAGDVGAARDAAHELADIAGAFDAPLMHAIAAHAEGAVRLAEGDPEAALEPLGEAWNGWQQVDAPYEGARTRVLIGLARRELGNHETASMELDAARRVFRELEAGPDAARVESLVRPKAPGPAGGLTPRQVEVLRLVTTGKTNRAIAEELHISEKTVARHMSDIFLKLGISSRAAATAYAYEHDLV
jgi:DNA-binding CsgD family transcriptional regulator/tetratricopeptide (TPR) repeat protein